MSNDTYKFNREDKIVVVEDRSHVEHMLPSLLDFFLLCEGNVFVNQSQLVILNPNNHIDFFGKDLCFFATTQASTRTK